MTASDRILSLRPADIRKLDDPSTAKLIGDLEEIGFSSVGLMADTPPATARAFLSSIRVWAQALQMAGGSEPAKPKRKRSAPEPDGWREVTHEELIEHIKSSTSAGPKPKRPVTRTERARQTDRAISVGITATEANEFLNSLPPYGETA